MIPFNRPAYTGNEDQYVTEAIRSERISGDGKFSRLAQSWFDKNLNCVKSLLTPSCTQALEMAAILLEIQRGDEVIMPSYTFVSTANAFALRGAKIIFVDIRPDTMNINENLITPAISQKTKAIVPVHYAGVGCEMNAINKIAEEHGIHVVEDAAQGLSSKYNSKPLGTFGHLSAFSFHETKNITSGGEGGLLVINDKTFEKRAEIIREKGTNRSQYFRGMVDKYTWIDIGSSYLPSELQAAYLWGQLEMADKITEKRIVIWNRYKEMLSELEMRGNLELPKIPNHCTHNGHIFYVKCHNLSDRTKVLEHLKKDGIMGVFHYIPLHSAPGGKRFGEFHGDDKYTTRESERLLRLPLWFNMDSSTQERIFDSLLNFFG